LCEKSAADVAAINEGQHDVGWNQQKRDKRDSKSKIRRGPQRLVTEAHHAIHGIFDEPAKRLFGLSGGTAFSLVQHAGLLESQPASQTGNETIALRQLIEFAHDLAIHQSENTSIRHGRQIADSAKNGIKKRKSDSARAGCIAPGCTLAEHDLKALF